MSRRKRAIIWVLFLSAIFGLIIWHVMYWHSTGMYREMFQWSQTARGYITALYNVGLMIVLGFTLGFLTEKIANLVGFSGHQTKHADDHIEPSKME